MAYAARSLTLTGLVALAAMTPRALHAQTPDAAPDAPAADAEPAPDAPPADAEPAPDAPPADAKPAPADGTPEPADDGWPDVSSFLEKKYGFLPIAMPITEPAVGYGAVGGLAFISAPLGQAQAGLGRPDVTFVGGLGTANGSWGFFGADLRYWLKDHLQTMVAFLYASINLDFHGIGKNETLQNNPLRYNLEPKGGILQAKYRIGESLFWTGLRYAFSSTQVSFDSPESTPELPDYDSSTRIGGLSVLAAFDNRDNMFTPLAGTLLSGAFTLSAPWLGGEHTFERGDLTAIQYFPLPFDFFLGLRAEGSMTFGDSPFYVLPYIELRGVPVMRYQGEEVAVLEAELRWQFYKRLSLVGFGGGGGAWNDFEKVDNSQGVFAGGTGFRYELARSYGLHMGVDVAFSRDTTAVYLQVGSAWARP